MEIKEIPEYSGFQVLELYVVFQRMGLLARMRTTLRARARKRRSSLNPHSRSSGFRYGLHSGLCPKEMDSSGLCSSAGLCSGVGLCSDFGLCPDFGIRSEVKFIFSRFSWLRFI